MLEDLELSYTPMLSNEKEWVVVNEVMPSPKGVERKFVPIYSGDQL